MTLEQASSRLIWQINRSPLSKFIKLVARYKNGNTVKARRFAARNEEIDHISWACSRRMQDDGYCIITDFIDTNLANELITRSTAFMDDITDRESKQLQETKPFWIRLLDKEMQDGQLPISSSWVRFAVQSRVRQILLDYFSEVPRLNYVLLTQSKYSPHPLIKSQLWHRDHDDVRVVKLFIYLSDVGSFEDGPFTFMPARSSDKIGYKFKSHMSDDDIFIKYRIPNEEIITMIAPKATVFMVDTARCLHMGSRLAEGHQRMLYTATYTTAPSIYPNFNANRFYYDEPFTDDIEALMLRN